MRLIGVALFLLLGACPGLALSSINARCSACRAVTVSGRRGACTAAAAASGSAATQAVVPPPVLGSAPPPPPVTAASEPNNSPAKYLLRRVHFTGRAGRQAGG
jgi:hypothetical protein